MICPHVKRLSPSQGAVTPHILNSSLQNDVFLRKSLLAYRLPNRFTYTMAFIVWAYNPCPCGLGSLQHRVRKSDALAPPMVAPQNPPCHQWGGFMVQTSREAEDLCSEGMGRVVWRGVHCGEGVDDLIAVNRAQVHTGGERIGGTKRHHA